MEKSAASVSIYMEYLENLDTVSLIVSTSSGLVEIRLVIRLLKMFWSWRAVFLIVHLSSEAKVNEDNIKLLVTDRSPGDGESLTKTIVVNFVDFKVDHSMSMTNARNKKISETCYDTTFK